MALPILWIAVWVSVTVIVVLCSYILKSYIQMDHVWFKSLEIPRAKGWLLFNRIFLRFFMVRRRNRQIDDIIRMIRQLLYFRHLPVNLHTKLRKCVPVVQTFRSELIQLVTEWYEDPKLAIEQFRDRLNNEHADGLCETLLSIFQFEHDEFYNHLQARMEDLKFVQRQLQEARREKRSYVLFVLAGIPLLHSFQILIFPWLSQGTGLFQQLN